MWFQSVGAVTGLGCLAGWQIGTNVSEGPATTVFRVKMEVNLSKTLTNIHQDTSRPDWGFPWFFSVPGCNFQDSIKYNMYGPGIYTSFRKLEHLKIQLARTFNRITFLTRCKSQGIIPKGLSLKTPVNSWRSSKIDQCASKALLRDRLHLYWHDKVTQQQFENLLKSSVSNSDLQYILHCCYPQKLALTSLTSSGCLVDIVRSQTQEFSLVF
jgi:hypothetical protein